MISTIYQTLQAGPTVDASDATLTASEDDCLGTIHTTRLLRRGIDLSQPGPFEAMEVCF
ncbi:MAG TPA: hypothetical protein VHZ33_26260 [Trebonia sp.]|nr:hypothetical protein [Trebonia sp.]